MTDPATDGPTRTQRRFVLALLVTFCIPGVVGFDLWPLTGWRLFSAYRGDTQVRFVLEAVDGSGATTALDPDELPYRFHSIEWPMSRLAGRSSADRAAACEALLEAALTVLPTTVEVRVIGDRQALVPGDGPGGFAVDHHRKEITSCRA